MSATPNFKARNLILDALLALRPDVFDGWVSLSGYEKLPGGEVKYSGRTGRMEQVEHTFPEDPFIAMFKEEGES